MGIIRLSKLRGHNWCKIVDTFQTSAIEQTRNAKLENLVDVFGLSGSLFKS